MARVLRSRRLRELRRQPARDLSAAGGLCRPAPARRQASGFAHRAGNPVRVRPQSQDRQDARHGRPGDGPRPRRRGDRMRRREFIAGLGGAAATPFAARAQQAERVRRIGFLGASTPSAWGHRVTAFGQRLHELGWTDGRNVAIEYLWTEGRNERSAEIAAEFVRLKVDIIVTASTASVEAAKKATSVIPIVFALESDPVGNNLVASLARPGGNITGLSLQQPDLAAKRLGLIREIVPNLRRLAIIVNPGAGGAIVELREVQTTARRLGIDSVTVEIRAREDFAPAMDSFIGRVDALYICGDPLFSLHQNRI